MKVLLLICSFLSLSTLAKIKSETVEYKEGETVLEGYVAYPEKMTKKTPVVILVHEWTGLGDFVKERANELAKRGYIAFGADIYGKGVRPSTPEEAGKTAGIYKSNRALLRKRAEAALNYVTTLKNVDSEKIVAAGFCFGGTTALEMGRAGQKLAGIVSFHGGLGADNITDAKNIKGQVLVLHGAVDPYVSETELKTFEKEMNDNKIDWRMVKYANAVHSFTNKAAGNDNSKGAAYNELADKRSMVDFMAFLNEVAPLKK